MTLLDELDELEKKATKGPWLFITDGMSDEDAQFCLRLANTYPAISAALRAGIAYLDADVYLQGCLNEAAVKFDTEKLEQARESFRACLKRLEDGKGR